MGKRRRESARHLLWWGGIAIGLGVAIIGSTGRWLHPAVSAVAPDRTPWSGLQYRNIGPFRGGRSVAVAGVASQPMTYYFGATGGGVWKTVDAGVSWEPISD
ncbi:MAG: hypothetical protein ACO394_13195, partial [Blastocatellia bacterium]